METRIATGIDTELFYNIIKYFIKIGWSVSLEYSTKCFDKGIDFDFYQLDKNNETILFAWTNWFEGELKTTREMVENIEKQFSLKFKFGEPAHLNNKNFVAENKELLDVK